MQRKVSRGSLVVLIVIISTQIVSAYYLPYVMYHGEQRGIIPMRRQDADDGDDEMDSNASAPYQNQDSGDGARDGYDDAEADGPYEETPRDQEGQADLERFFDDHLGASDRDGMDKENLPTNVLPIVVMPMKGPLNADQPPPQQQPQPSALQTVHTEFIRLPDEKLIITRQVTHDTSKLGQQHNYAPAEPNKRQQQQQPYRIPAPVALISSDEANNLNKNNFSVQIGRPRSSIEFNNDHNPNSEQAKLFNSISTLDDRSAARDGSDPLGGDGVVVTEDDDFKRVYMTKATHKPFKIDALGGFDPEEAFDDASREMNGSKKSPTTRQRRHNDINNNNEGEQSTELSDDEDGQATSPEPDTDTLWDDASNTDEITFGQDDPYQTDLEAEMRSQAYDKVGIFNAQNNAQVAPTTQAPKVSPSSDSKQSVANDDGDDIDNDDDDGQRQQHRQQPQMSETNTRREPVESEQQYARRRSDDNDANSRGRKRLKGLAPSRKGGDVDDESDWAHDGVEDMDIPSQARQNQVLEKAAKHDELARRKAEEEAAAAEEAGNETPPPDESEEGQRMPNADYMKADMREPDESYRS